MRFVLKSYAGKLAVTVFPIKSILCNAFWLEWSLKVHSCKLYNDKFMNASTQKANTEIFAFVAAPVFKLLRCKVLFINRKDSRNC